MHHQSCTNSEQEDRSSFRNLESVVGAPASLPPQTRASMSSTGGLVGGARRGTNSSGLELPPCFRNSSAYSSASGYAFNSVFIIAP